MTVGLDTLEVSIEVKWLIPIICTTFGVLIKRQDFIHPYGTDVKNFIFINGIFD